MSNEYRILEIEPQWRGNVEQLGSKPKFWFRYREQDWLFKEARPNTGEHWAEKIASEVAVLLDLPTHQVELAKCEAQIGCAVRSFLSPLEVLVHGNEVLGGVIEGYDRDKVRGQADHNFDNIVTVIEWWFREGRAREVASLRFVGHLVLDALVGNTDRHHENWGLRLLLSSKVVDEENPGTGIDIEIAPTFDHASSLGRELLDEKRRAILDNSVGLRRYIRKAKGGIFRDSDARKGLSPLGVLELIAERYPRLLEPWQKRVEGLDTNSFTAIIDRVPDEWMSSLAKEFALAFLSESRNLILCIK